MNYGMQDKRIENNGRNTQMSRRQIKYRKRMQQKKWILFLVKAVVLIIFILCIKKIYARLDDIQMDVQRIEIQHNGTVQTDAEAYISEDMDYVGSIAPREVEKPIERTEAEVLQRLEELAQDNSVIGDIYRNHSRYSEELLAALANNPEMADFVAGYPDGRGGAATGGITALEKEQEFPLFLQWDPRWGYEPYGESCIGLAGCGPTCLSMVLFYLTGDETITPDKIARYSMENGYYVKGTGTAWALMKDVPTLYRIKAAEISSSEQNIRTELDKGNIIICAMGRGFFTTFGHYIVIYGYDKDGFMVNDPNCVARSNVRWTFEEIQYQIKNIWSYGIS